MSAVLCPSPCAALAAPSARPLTEFSLWFASAPRLELLRTAFRSPSIPSEIHSVRGKTCRAHSGAVTFQWTAAVQAFSVFFLKAAALGRLAAQYTGPIVEGGPSSIAASIDAALYKDNAWLELFGSDLRGDCLSRRIILRTNPGRRRPGPVTIALNERVLPKDAIVVLIDDKRIHDPAVIERHADSLEAAWNAERSTIASFPSVGLQNPLRL